MNFLIDGAGYFIYPLGICSLVALYVFIERFIALRDGKVIPNEISNAIIAGDISTSERDDKTSIGRIVNFYKTAHPDSDAIKAFAHLEMTRLERGMFLLDVAVGAAPLLGLLGTVAGLVSVFSVSGAPTQDTITHGVGLALSTTILGLSIAIPAMLGSSYLYRKVDTLSARMNICVERLVDIRNLEAQKAKTK